MPAVKLGLCSRRPGELTRSAALDSLQNAVQFYQFSQDKSPPGETPLSVAQLDSGASDLVRSLDEALQSDVTHVLFLSPRTLFPFYSLQSMVDLEVDAVSGVSWTWVPGRSGDSPDIFPRLGYFDPEGRPFPYFGWSAPGLFEVAWCGLDCLLLSRRALQKISGLIGSLHGVDPCLKISHCLKLRGIPLLIDSSVQCPRIGSYLAGDGQTVIRKLFPEPKTWRDFSVDLRERRLPLGPVYDPAYRGRQWYREWLGSVLSP